MECILAFIVGFVGTLAIRIFIEGGGSFIMRNSDENRRWSEECDKRVHDKVYGSPGSSKEELQKWWDNRNNY